MKKLIAGVVLGVGLSMTAYGQGDPAAGEAQAAPCAACHGPAGTAPIMDAYPKLSGLGETYLYNQLVAIRDGDRPIPEMIGQLDGKSDEDLSNLAAYFNEQEMPLGQADPELAELGAALYMGGNLASGVPACAACHNPQGKGNEPAGYPHLGGQTAGYLAKQLNDYRDAARGGYKSQIMVDIASRLTDDEIEALSSYISGLH